MRRLLVTAVLVPALLALVVLGMGASEEDGGYRIRAIFDNVAAAVPGEDVKVAGAKVGEIESMDVTDDNKAAVTLRIEDGRFTPFRGDARCRVRPQSLIGEKFVECDPGTADQPPLREIEDGEGEGDHLLPLARTGSMVDPDLVNDIMRLPYRQRFAILLAELGTGLAGRGEELNEVIHRANPALRETDRVLAILARENRVLARLAEDSDAALAPLAREKRRVSGFIRQANATAQASAERRGDIEASIQRLPAFLRELRPLMADLGSAAGQGTPVLAALRRAGPDLSRAIVELEPFSRAARPAIRSLGAAAVRGRPALIRARPVVRDLRRFGRDAAPVSADLDRLTASLDATRAIKPLMEALFFSATAANGFDDAGHYLRASLVANVCADYSLSPAAGCLATFGGGASSSASSSPATVEAAPEEPAPAGSDDQLTPLQPLTDLTDGARDPAAKKERERNLERLRRQAGQPSPGLGDLEDPLMDYLLEDGPR
jgi:ABC-type transporter Mla subunit MlaD